MLWVCVSEALEVYLPVHVHGMIVFLVKKKQLAKYCLGYYVIDDLYQTVL